MTESRFSDFEVMRVGQTVVLSCFDSLPPPKGSKLQVTLECSSQEEAEQHEAMFSRLVHCASVMDDVPDNALDATDKLMKGQRI